MRQFLKIGMVLWGVATSAGAQGEVRAAATGERPSVRLRSSHTVDVIAPGENVKTVLDSMRRADIQQHRVDDQNRPGRSNVRQPPGRGAGMPPPGVRGKEGQGRPQDRGMGAPRDGRNDGPPPPPNARPPQHRR